MARSSAEITQQEVDAFQQFARQHNIIDDESAEGQKNGELLGGVIVLKWQVDITPATLADAYNQIKDHLVHYTPLQIEHRQISARLSEQDRNTILHAVSARGLKDTGDDQLANFNSIAKYLTDKNMPITAGNIDMVLPNIVSSSQYRLTWKKRLQDSEREAQAAREAAKQQPVKNGDDEVKIPAGLNPALHEHYRQTHRKAETAARSTAATTQSHFESMARSATASIQSNVDRAEAERLLMRAGAWGWELVYRSIESFIQSRKQQRWMAGR